MTRRRRLSSRPSLKSWVVFCKVMFLIEWLLNHMTLLMKVTWQVEGHWTAFAILCKKLVEIWNLKQSTWHDIQQQSFSILRKTSSIWQLFPHNLGDGNQLFQIKFISLVLQPLYLPGSFLFKFYFTLTKLARNSQILHRKQSKNCNKRKKNIFFLF